jgi:hypothetical protein
MTGSPPMAYVNTEFHENRSVSVYNIDISSLLRGQLANRPLKKLQGPMEL